MSIVLGIIPYMLCLLSNSTYKYQCYLVFLLDSWKYGHHKNEVVVEQAEREEAEAPPALLKLWESNRVS